MPSVNVKFHFISYYLINDQHCHNKRNFVRVFLTNAIFTSEVFHHKSLCSEQYKLNSNSIKSTLNTIAFCDICGNYQIICDIKPATKSRRDLLSQ